MIFGRSPNLVLGAFTALLNAIVLLGVVHLDATQLAGVNTAAGAIIVLIANTNSIQIAAGKAAADRDSSK